MKIHKDAYVSQHAILIGDIEIEEGANIWPGAVLRADMGKISIGKNTSIQDNVVIHSDPGDNVVIGDNVIVGHGAVIHGATIKEYALIGIRAVLLNHSIVNEYAIVGACSLVNARTEVPTKTVYMGIPAQFKREATEKDIAYIKQDLENYARLLKNRKG